MLQRCLEEHPDDGHHCQAAVCQLRIEFLSFLSWVGRSQDLEAKVSSGGRCSSRLILGNLAERHVGQDLSPACGRHFGNCGKSVGDVRELQPCGWTEVTRELASDPWSIKQQHSKTYGRITSRKLTQAMIPSLDCKMQL